MKSNNNNNNKNNNNNNNNNDDIDNDDDTDYNNNNNKNNNNNNKTIMLSYDPLFNQAMQRIGKSYIMFKFDFSSRHFSCFMSLFKCS